MRAAVVAVLLASLCLGAADARAQAAPAPGASRPAPIGALLENAPPGAGLVGDWAEYAVLDKGKADLTQTIRFSILADEDARKAPWLEVWMDKVGRSALRFRTGEGGSDVFLKLGAAIFTISDEATQKALTCPSGACHANTDKASKVPTVPVTVQTVGGTYTCRYGKLQTKDGPIEVWSADEVSALHMVRLKLPNGTGYELVASGKGSATSAFPKHFVANPLPLQNLKGLEALVPQAVRPAPGSAPLAPDAGAALPALPDGGLRQYVPPQDGGRP